MVYLNDPHSFLSLCSNNKNISLWLSKESNINSFFDKLSLFCSDNILRKDVVTLLSSFSKEYDMIIHQYFKNEIDLKCTLYYILDFIKINNFPLNGSVAKLKKIYSQQEKSITDILKIHLTSFDIMKFSPIFGLGIGNGLFEKEISTMINSKIIYGYDKNHFSNSEYIQYVQRPCDLIDRIGLFSARWVLHHLPKKDRWESLREWFNKMDVHSTCVFVEEGYFYFSNKTSIEYLFYNLILAVFDIYSNLIFMPEWVSMNKNEYDEKFDLEYLTIDDINTIRYIFSPSSSIKIIPSYSDYFVENIIIISR